MSLSIDPKELAKLTVQANPSNGETPEEKAKDSLELYLCAYKIAEKYMRYANSSQETSEVLKKVLEEDIHR